MRLAVLALLVGARLAAAGPSVGVVVTGEPTLQGKIRGQVSSWLSQHGFTVNAKPLAADALKTLANCFVIEDMACAKGVVEHQATVDYVVFVRADLVGGKKSKEANLVAYWFLKDRDAVADKRNCKPCATQVLAKTATELIAAVYDETALAKAHLKIAEPPGLVVMLDGTNVGVTPVEQDVAPGTHEIRLQRDDQVLGTTTIEAKAGDQTDVKVPLKAVDVPVDRGPHTTVGIEVRPPQEQEPHHPSRIVPGLMIALGAGAVITGGVFVYYGHKNGPDDPLIYPDATKQGAIIAGAGGAVLITGLVIWWVQGSSSTNGPTAQLTPGGTIVGWAGQF